MHQTKLIILLLKKGVHKLDDKIKQSDFLYAYIKE